MQKNWQIKVPVAKLYAPKMQVFGFASVIDNPDGTPLVDHDGDVIDESALELAAYNYLLGSREGHVIHNGVMVAQLIESLVITAEKKELLHIDHPRGWWVGFQIYDSEIWRLVENGQLRMFSIGGQADRMEMPEEINVAEA